MVAYSSFLATQYYASKLPTEISPLKSYALHVILVYSRLQVTGHNQLGHEGHMDHSVFDWSIVS